MMRWMQAGKGQGHAATSPQRRAYVGDLVRYGGLLRSVSAVAALLFASACPQKPVPDPAPAPTPAPPPVAPPPPPAPPSPGPQDIVVNQADLFGQFENRQGALVTIRALIVTAKNKPQAGHKGVISCAPNGGGSDDDWVPVADVEVKKPLDDSGRIQVRLTDANKPLLLPGSKKPTPLPKNARLRLRWEY